MTNNQRETNIFYQFVSEGLLEHKLNIKII
jgi:hypothetical protein